MWNITGILPGDKTAEVIEVGIHGLEFSKIGDSESDFASTATMIATKDTATFFTSIIR